MAFSAGWQTCPTGIRVFNLICCLIFPASLIFVGVFIMWSLIIVVIERLFLNLRSIHNAEKIDWDGKAYCNTEANEGIWRTHAPRGRGRNMNIFGGGTKIRLSTINPATSIGVIVTRTEERWSAPMPHVRESSPKQAHTLVPRPDNDDLYEEND